MLFLQGTRDELATLNLIEQVCNSLPSATLIQLEMANHSFYIPKKDAIPMLVKATTNWLKTLK